VQICATELSMVQRCVGACVYLYVSVSAYVCMRMTACVCDYVCGRVRLFVCLFVCDVCV